MELRHFAEGLGYLGSALGVAMVVPQIVRTYRNRTLPGVSAMSAVPASAGIPVTHRGVAAQVTLVSGHSANGDDLDYAQLASTPGTLVVFMGLGHLDAIVGGLVRAGKPASTPAAVVSRGTHPDGRSVSGTLAGIAGLVDGLVSPALLVVGDVVGVLDRTPSRREGTAVPA